AGVCAPEGTCAPNQTSCNHVCVNTQSDPKNCGACGNACTGGASCVVGSCVSKEIMASCGQPVSSGSVLAQPDGSVVTYLPRGSSLGGDYPKAFGIQYLVLEGGVSAAQVIPTTTIINSCASNWVTGETVCVSDGKEVYILRGTEIVATLT